MSTDPESSFAGAPELTPLGKRIEVLRIQRGLSKQHLARQAGTSRQQLWRVMTGKSELTSSLQQRLAQVLSVESGSLTTSIAAAGSFTLTPSVEVRGGLGEFLDDPARLERVIGQLPDGDDGVWLKRALLDAIEQRAMSGGVTLPASIFELRRRVLAGEC